VATLNAPRIRGAWEAHRLVIDAYGADTAARGLFVDPAVESPKIARVVAWLEQHRSHLEPFLRSFPYDWAFDGDAYEVGAEAHCQVQILQQLSALHGMYVGAGKQPPPMGDVVARRAFSTSYDMMSPRYWPKDGIHFIIIPHALSEWNNMLWWAMRLWCEDSATSPLDPWDAVTHRPDAHPSDTPSPNPPLLELIARQLAEDAKDLDLFAPDAAGVLATELSSLEAASGLAWPEPITAFDEDIAYSLLDWVLSHELGHRLCSHMSHP
jgi:hypothetical protein